VDFSWICCTTCAINPQQIEQVELASVAAARFIY
jgi:hypothetical protein